MSIPTVNRSNGMNVQNKRYRSTDDVEITTKFWKDITWRGLTIRVYKDTDEKQSHKFYVMPSLRLVAENGKIKVEQTGKKEVDLTLEFLPPDLVAYVLGEIKKEDGKNEQKKVSISLLPTISYIRMKALNEDISSCQWKMGLSRFGRTKLLEPGDKEKMFTCKNEEQTRNFVKLVQSKKAKFSLDMSLSGLTSVPVKVAVKVKDIQEKDFENDIGPGRKMSSQDQYFSAQQIANACRRAMMRMEVEVNEREGYKGKFITPQSLQNLVQGLMNYAFKKAESHPMDGETAFLIGNKNLDPSLIRKQSKTVNSFYQDFKSRLLDSLKRYAQAKKSSDYQKDVKDHVTRDMQSGSSDTTTNTRDYFQDRNTKDFHKIVFNTSSFSKENFNKMFTDAQKYQFRSFGDDSLNVLKKHVADALKKSQFENLQVEGELITPRRIELYRNVGTQSISEMAIGFINNYVLKAEQGFQRERTSSRDIAHRFTDLSKYPVGREIMFSDEENVPNGWVRFEGQEIRFNPQDEFVRLVREDKVDRRYIRVKEENSSNGTVLKFEDKPGYIIKIKNSSN